VDATTDATEGWIKIRKGRNTNPFNQSKPTFYQTLSHLYATLPEYAAAPPITTINQDQHNNPSNAQGTLIPVPSTFKHKAHRKYLARTQTRQDCSDDHKYGKQHIQWAADELTTNEHARLSNGCLAAKV
jgi:hypothetical protein